MYGTKFIKLCIVDQYAGFFLEGDSFLFYSTAVARAITCLFLERCSLKTVSQYSAMRH